MSSNLSELMRTPARQLLGLYSELDAPDVMEMRGEYAATLLPQLHPLIELLGRWSVYNPLYPGYWLAKGFAPVSEATGQGYNLFRFRNRMAIRWPMQTLVHPSRFDGRAAYQLVYPACRSICARINMIDEVRRIDDGLYLGFGTCGFGGRMRRLRLPFALQGPIREFRSLPEGVSESRNLQAGELAQLLPPAT